MKRNIALLLIASLTLTLHAKEYSHEQMVELLEKQEKRVDVLVNEFFTLNEAIETKIQNVVTHLSKLEDSSESKTRVSNLKSSVMDELKTSIQNLQKQRSANAAMLARLPSNYREGDGAARSNQYLDEKVSVRVQQVMEMANSLYQSKDVKKYDYVVKNSFDDDLRVSKRKSDEWKEDRKQTINANQDREKLIKEIEAAENRLTQQINHVKAEQQSMGGAPLPEEIAQDVANKQDLLDTLGKMKMEILEGKTIDTEKVGSTKAAMEMERQVSLALQDLRTANAKLRQKGQELQKELLRLDGQQAKLAEFEAKAK